VIDGRNRRVGKKVNGVLVQGLLYRGQLQPVAELDGAGNIVSRFVYATRVNVPDYIVKPATGAVWRVVTDHLGSVRLVIDHATGAVIQQMDYDEFGRVLLDTNPGAQPFGFAGGIWDAQVGLVRFGARDYDPVAGRWTTKDPIRFAAGDSNLYAYCYSDPVNYFDLDGRIVLNAGGALVGGIVGAIAGGLTGGWKGAIAGGIGGAVGGALLNPHAGFLAANLVSGFAGSFTQAVISEGFETARCGFRPLHSARRVFVETTTGTLLGLGGGILGEIAGARAAIHGASDAQAAFVSGLASADYTILASLPSTADATGCGCGP